jgi:hypothetical protein
LKQEVRPLQGDGVSIGIKQFDPLRVREYTLLELKRVIVRRGDDPNLAVAKPDSEIVAALVRLRRPCLYVGDHFVGLVACQSAKLLHP